MAIEPVVDLVEVPVEEIIATEDAEDDPHEEITLPDGNHYIALCSREM
jgi:hypothetical protein